MSSSAGQSQDAEKSAGSNPVALSVPRSRATLTVGDEPQLSSKDVQDLEKASPRPDAGIDPDDEENDNAVDPSPLYATSSTADLPPPPDGGRRAWTQVAMCWIVTFVTWGYINSFGAFQGYYVTVLPEPASTISWIGGIHFWFTFFAGAFSGRLFDAGYFVPVFVVGAVLHLLGIFLMSVSDTFWKLLLTQGMLTGLGNGIMFVPCMALVATYFDKKRALAVGLVTTGNSAGGLVYPAIVKAVIPHLGFPWTARVLGFMNLSGLILAGIFMRPYLPPRLSGPMIELSAFKELVYAAYVASLFAFVWGNYYTLFYLSTFGVQVIGMPFTEAANLITIVNGVGLPIRIIVPFLAFKIGPLNSMTITAVLTAIVAFSWLAVNDTTGTYIYATCYGMATASFQCLMPTGMANVTPKLNKVGVRLGMAFSVTSFAGLSGPPLGGAIEAATSDGCRRAQAWAATVTLLAGVAMGTSRLAKTGFVAKVKV